MKDNRQIFAIVGLVALIAAAIGVAFMATRGAAPTTDVQSLQTESQKAVPSNLGNVGNQQASADAMSLNSIKKHGKP